MNHLKSLLIMFFLVALLTSACGQADQDKKDSTPLIIGYSQWAGSGVLNIADEKAFFEAEGVNVQLVFYSNPNAILDSLAAGKIDGGAITLPDVINSTASATPLEVVWATDMSAGGDMLIGARGLLEPADLKGKRVGFVVGSFGELFVREGLKKYSLTENDIIPVNVEPDQIPAALKAGEIDAGHTWDPFASQAIDDGAAVLFTSVDTPGTIMDVLAFRSDVVKDRPDAIHAVTRALSTSIDFWQQHPAESNTLVARANAIPEDEIAGVLSGIQRFTLQDNRVVLDQASSDPRSAYRSGQAAADFLLSAGSISALPDLNSLINPSFVQG